MTISKHKLKQFAILSGGLTCIIIGNLFNPHQGGTEYANLTAIILSEIVIDFGIGLFVASAVSLIFDVWYHRALFGEPVEDIDNKVKALSSSVSDMASTVIDFNQVLKSTQANGIHAIYRRKTDQEILEWKDRIKYTISNSNQYVFIMGRTLDTVLPSKYKDNGIYSILAEKIKEVPIIFLFADPFDSESDFRLEAKERAGDHDNSLYVRTRDSIKQILDLSERQRDSSQISVRLLKKGPPFALFMTEKTALIEPYLPYLEGGESIVYEVHANNAITSPSTVVSKNLHSAHKVCFGKLYSHSRHISEALDEYVERKSKDRSDIGGSFSLYQEIAKRLKMEENDTIKKAELY
jgi:hypothetical protein